MTDPQGEGTEGFWRVAWFDPPHAVGLDDLFSELGGSATDIPVIHTAMP